MLLSTTLLGRWAVGIGAAALERGAVEDGLFFAAERTGLVAEDRPHRYWATIRSGLSVGVQDPIGLATERAER